MRSFFSARFFNDGKVAMPNGGVSLEVPGLESFPKICTNRLTLAPSPLNERRATSAPLSKNETTALSLDYDNTAGSEN